MLPFIPNWNDLRPFAAELWLVAGIAATLLAPFVYRKPNSACALAALLAIGAGVVSLLAVGPTPVGAGRLDAMIVQDGLAFSWKLLLLIFSAGVVLLWFAATRRSMREGDAPEFFTLLLGAALGLAVMASAANLLMVFLAVEAASLPSYALAAFRKTERPGAEAGLKYVLFGAVCTAIFVYGLSLLYGLYGTLALYPHDADPGLARLMVGQLSTGAVPPVLAVAGLCVICGLGFKIAAAPVHFWCPDVFEGAGIDVAAYLSVASKGAGIVLLTRLAMAVAEAAGYRSNAITAPLALAIGLIGALTCTVGNAGALLQNNVKRLLAYSSIAHAGYMLCVLSLLVRVRSRASVPGDLAAQALLIYLAVYLFMNLGAFTVAALVAQRRGGASDAGGPDVSDFAGLGRVAPTLSICMTAFLFSLIGLPPLAGFTAKFNLLRVLADNGGLGWALAGVIVVNTVVSAFYYARILKAIYFDGAPVSSAPADALDADPYARFRLGRWLSGGCAVALVALFVFAYPLGSLASRFGQLHAPGAAPASDASLPSTPPPTASAADARE